jgi:cytidine deaminase
MVSDIAEGSWPKDGELFVGLVAPIGADLEGIITALTTELSKVDYKPELVHLTKILQQVEGFAVPKGPEDERIKFLMGKGNELRSKSGRKDAMALLGVGGIVQSRRLMVRQGVERRAYIIRQLKRPEEVETFRRLYGENFVVIATTQPESERIEALSTRIASSESRAATTKDDEVRAEKLMRQDEREEDSDGQNLRDTFATADLFVDPANRNSLHEAIVRFIDLLFERRVRTPTKDEYAMFQAWGAALRSGSLARQVGACVYDDRGSTVSTGTNDVPRANGGLYSEDDEDDKRDHVLGHDHSDRRRRDLLEEVISVQQANGWFSETVAKRPARELAEEALIGSRPILKGSRLNALIEFVRAAHAEQSAIADAARRGVPLLACSLAVTTFPCHECARLILAAGIKRVLFIEPYPKSLASEMYADSINFGSAKDGMVSFEPFIGIAPRVYTRLFAIGGERKHADGAAVIRNGADCQIRLTYNGSRLDTQRSEMAAFGGIRSLFKPSTWSNG